MSFNQFFLSIIGLTSLLTACVVGHAADEAAHVVVVVNANDSGSTEIAKYYTEQRGIPKANIIALEMPTKETVTVREFVDTIYNPLLNALIEKDWMNVVKANGRDVVGRVVGFPFGSNSTVPSGDLIGLSVVVPAELFSHQIGGRVGDESAALFGLDRDPEPSG